MVIKKTDPKQLENMLQFLLKRFALILVFFVFLILPNGAYAQTSNQEKNKLKELKAQIKKSQTEAKRLKLAEKKIKEELTALREKIISSAQKIQVTEEKITHQEKSLQKLNFESAALRKDLKKRYKQMSKTLAAMQRLSQQPANLAAIRPGKSLENLRVNILLKKIMPSLKQKAENIKKDVNQINQLKHLIKERKSELKKSFILLTKDETEINAILKTRRLQQKAIIIATKKERQKLKRFAQKSKTIKELITKIEKEKIARKKRALAQKKLTLTKGKTPREKPNKKTLTALSTLPQGAHKFYSAKGKMPMPARGDIKTSFGYVNSQGQKSKGITINTRAGAVVIAPHAGRVMFAGKFRTYGLLLIIDHGDGYHTLLAGMDHINAVVGQQISGGEPVGLMKKELTTKKIAAGASSQRLYVEFRRKGQPINPIKWVKKS